MKKCYTDFFGIGNGKVIKLYDMYVGQGRTAVICNLGVYETKFCLYGALEYGRGHHLPKLGTEKGTFWFAEKG